jgi:hypothetical protein
MSILIFGFFFISIFILFYLVRQSMGLSHVGCLVLLLLLLDMLLNVIFTFTKLSWICGFFLIPRLLLPSCDDSSSLTVLKLPVLILNIVLVQSDLVLILIRAYRVILPVIIKILSSVSHFICDIILVNVPISTFLSLL